MNILIVEDNEIIKKGLKYYLESENYNIDLSSTYNEAIEKLDSNTYDLAILDISLPDNDGFSLCNYIKEYYKYPVIFLTAKDDIDDIVKGLDIGDDYIIKPFHNRELLSRIKKLLSTNIKIGDIEINVDKKQIYRNQKIVNLTSLEYKLFLILLKNKNKVLSKDFLLDFIEMETGNFVNDNTLRVYIKRIREKLNDEEIIKTIKGSGYIVNER